MIILEAGKMTERAGAHEYLAAQLAFPDYYGKNLDALFDCLTDLDDTDVVFVDTGTAEGSYFDEILPVFQDAAEENSRLRILNAV